MQVNYMATILAVDGSPAGLELLKERLHGRYAVALAGSGAEALQAVRRAPAPQLIVLGTALPDMDAAALLRELRADFLAGEIPVIVTLESGAADGEQRAFEAGAADVVTRPVAAATLHARVATQLELARARATLKDGKRHLEFLVAERTREAVQTQDAMILAMAALAETRDNETGNHLRRTQHFFGALARELRFHAPYSAELDDETVALMTRAAPLHDIGKVGLPDSILQKPGRLTPAEFEQMKLHTVHGRDAIASVERSMGAGLPFLRHAREIAYSHQEKWDGSGYPQGLKGTAIPLSARLMAVADVYDALISKRVYKPAFTHETAVELIRQGRGEHFDPDVVDAMLAVEEKFKLIAAEFRDPEQP